MDKFFTQMIAGYYYSNPFNVEATASNPASKQATKLL